MRSIEYINLFISIFTFFGGLYMYIIHTCRLNQQQNRLNMQQEQLNAQQAKLNEYLLQKSKEETLEKRQAFIEAYVYRTQDGKGKPVWKMRIYNKGKSKARNIKFESKTLDNDNGIHLLIPDDMFPIPSIQPQGYVDICIMLLVGHNLSHKIKFIWDDETGVNRSQEQDVLFQ